MRKTNGKAWYGTVEGVSYAFRVDGVDGGEFFGLPFGRRIEATNRLMAYQYRAKHVGYSEGNQKAVKEWVKEVQPSQFFAFWRSGRFYHDDYIEFPRLKRRGPIEAATSASKACDTKHYFHV